MSGKSYSLSQSDVQKLVPGITVTLYTELAGKSLAQLLDSKGRGMVLFVESETPLSISGHWLALIMQPSEGGLLIFDPYGGKVDPWYLDRTFVSARDLATLKESAPLLTDIVQSSGVRPLYSPIRYQQMKEDINTCGRHCVVRIWHQNKNNAEYDMYMRSFGRPFDDVVTELTMQVLGKGE